MNSFVSTNSKCVLCYKEVSASPIGMTTSGITDSPCTTQGCILHGSLSTDRCKEGQKLLKANVLCAATRKAAKV